MNAVELALQAQHKIGFDEGYVKGLEKALEILEIFDYDEIGGIIYKIKAELKKAKGE